MNGIELSISIWLCYDAREKDEYEYLMKSKSAP